MQIDGKGGVGFTRGTATIELQDQPDGGTLMTLHVGRADRRQDRRGRPAAARVGQQDDDAAGARGAGPGTAARGSTRGRERLVKPAPFEYFRPRSLDEALDAAGRARRRRQAAGRRPEPDSGDELPAGDAGGAGRPERDRRARRRDSRRRRRSADRRHDAAARARAQRLVARDAPLVAQTMPFVAHAGDPHARHDRRQPRARRSGRRAAGRDAGARRDASRCAAGERSRTVRAADFFTGLFTTALEPGELLTEVDDSAAAGAQRLRVPGDLAAARRLRAGRRRGRRCRSTARPLHEARIALLSVGDRPVLAEHASASARRAACRRRRRFAPPPTRPPRTTSIRRATSTRRARYRRHLARGPDRRVARARLRDSLETIMKIYDLSQPLNEQVLLLAVLSAVRGEVHQAQGRARRQRAVHHDVEPHGHPPRRAAPLRHRRHDDRRDPGRVAVRARRRSSTCRTRWTSSTSTRRR